MASDQTSDLIPLAELPAELRQFVDPADTAALNSTRYQALWGCCCDGTIPAEKHGGRWFVRRGHLPEIAKARRLKVPAAVKPARVRRAASPSSANASAASPAAAKPARAKRTTPPSSMDAAA